MKSIDYYYNNEFIIEDFKYNDKSTDYYFNKVMLFSNKFTKEELEALEDEIFTKKISKKKRVEMELKRLKEELGNDRKNQLLYYETLTKLNKLLKVSDLSSDILDEAYVMIVGIQIKCNMRVRLYSAYALLKEQGQMKLLK